MKKVLFAMLVVCVGALFFDTVSATEYTDGNYTYIVKNGEATITGCYSVFYTTVIPDKIGGYPVTGIGEGAFSGCTGLVNLEISDSVQNIEYSAFSHCTNLSKVIMGDSVATIGEYAFAGCTGLTSITIPNSVLYIGRCAFEDCTGLKEIKIGDSVITIGEAAFSGCNGLVSVIIPDSVETIGNNSFGKCTGLKDVTIGNSVVTIGSMAFYNCSGLTSIIIPDSVVTVGYSAFSGCNGLEEATLGDSVEILGECAFYGCSALKKVTLGDSLTVLGDGAFRTGRFFAQIDYKGTKEEWKKISREGNSNIENWKIRYLGVVGVSFDKTKISMEIDENVVLNTVFMPDYAYNKNVIWESSDERVAVVNEGGTVTAIDAGTAVITAITEDGGYVAECEVAVLIPLTVTSVRVLVQTYKFYIDCENSLVNEMLTVACYDESGRLLYVGCAECDGDNQYRISIPKDMNIKNAKVFLWDSGDALKPLGIAEKVVINAED